MNGVRVKKPPTRRQIASTLSDVIPVLNQHANNQDYLKRQLDNLNLDYGAFKAQSRWLRLKWVLGL